MTLVFLDSFDHYPAGNILEKWTNGSGSTFVTGRWDSTSALRLEAGGSSRTISKTFSSGHATWIFGAAFQVESIPASTLTFLQLMEGGTIHIDLRCTNSGYLQITRNGSSLGTGSTALTPSVWYYLELKVVINDTTGVAHLKINGITEMNLTSQDTQNGGTGVINTVLLRGGGPPGTRWDDLYFCDGSGGSPTNDFLGDIRVQAIFPDGNGNSSQLVGSDGNSTDNYLLVDETSPDGADYVESSTVGDKDTYTYGALTPTTGTVYGVQITPRANKTDAGTRSIVSVARLSGTETDGPVQTLSSSSLYYPDIRETKPGGGTWSISDVNSSEFGVKINA